VELVQKHIHSPEVEWLIASARLYFPLLKLARQFSAATQSFLPPQTESSRSASCWCWRVTTGLNKGGHEWTITLSSSIPKRFSTSWALTTFTAEHSSCASWKGLFVLLFECFSIRTDSHSSLLFGSQTISQTCRVT